MAAEPGEQMILARLGISRSSSWTSIICKQVESFSTFYRTSKLSSSAFCELTNQAAAGGELVSIRVGFG